MSNPYSTPSFDSFGSSPYGGSQQRYEPGLVNQVRIYAILSIVQGALELVIGLFYIGMGIFLMQVMSAAAREQGDGADVDPEQMATFLFILQTSLGAATMIAGGLHIFAGIRNYNLKSRVLGFIALAGGLLALPSVYCIFTGIALGVYGLIVLLNSQVVLAFEMRKKGEPAESILAKFSPY